MLQDGGPAVAGGNGPAVAGGNGPAVAGGNGPAVAGGNGKLRHWLMDQIDSRLYPGLVWENEEKSVFRIPWKHAGKQDYNRDEDAALFKAWAMFKGKFRDGVDKPDPPTWKTRLRCALNKSNDFDELVERSQLDISEPYKVYRIIPEGAKPGIKTNVDETPSHAAHNYTPYTSLHNQASSYMVSEDRRDWRDYASPEQTMSLSHQPVELQFGHYSTPYGRAWPAAHPDNGVQLSYLSDPPMHSLDQINGLADFRLHVSLFYRDSLVKEVTTCSPHGCRITSSSSSSCSSSSSSSSGEEVIVLPGPAPQREGAGLEEGVLLWLGVDGLYGQRRGQGRVYWEGPLAPPREGPLAPHMEGPLAPHREGPLAPHREGPLAPQREGPLAPPRDEPHTLDQEQPWKLFDTQTFLSELQDFALGGRRVPRHQVVLRFGDEFPDPLRTRKMITAQVEPVFARKLVNYYQNNIHYLQDTSTHCVQE